MGCVSHLVLPRKNVNDGNTEMNVMYLQINHTLTQTQSNNMGIQMNHILSLLFCFYLKKNET